MRGFKLLILKYYPNTQTWRPPCNNSVDCQGSTVMRVVQVMLKFLRITTKPLQSKFMSEFDRLSTNLLQTFQNKGGVKGKTMKGILSNINLVSRNSKTYFHSVELKWSQRKPCKANLVYLRCSHSCSRSIPDRSPGSNWDSFSAPWPLLGLHNYRKKKDRNLDSDTYSISFLERSWSRFFFTTWTQGRLLLKIVARQAYNASRCYAL